MAKQPTQAIDWNHLLQLLQSLPAFGQEVADLLQRLVSALKQPPQGMTAEAAQDCEPDQCACDCLRQQREALVTALSHNLHLTARFEEE